VHAIVWIRERRKKDLRHFSGESSIGCNIQAEAFFSFCVGCRSTSHVNLECLFPPRAARLQPHTEVQPQATRNRPTRVEERMGGKHVYCRCMLVYRPLPSSLSFAVYKIACLSYYPNPPASNGMRSRTIVEENEVR